MQRFRRITSDVAGQTTTEYATILLVVVLVTGALAAFVKGGGLDALFENVVRDLIDRAKG